jgi:hypothetical protein
MLYPRSSRQRPQGPKLAGFALLALLILSTAAAFSFNAYLYSEESFQQEAEKILQGIGYEISLNLIVGGRLVRILC